MISGDYSLALGAVLFGMVYFPPPVDELLEVPFVVDTGALRTCIALKDLIRLSTDVPEKLVIKPGDALRGVGGVTVGLTTNVGIAFTHDDQDKTTFHLDATLLMDPNSLGLPSFLGRDILFNGEVSLDPTSETVRCDFPRGIVRL